MTNVGPLKNRWDGIGSTVPLLEASLETASAANAAGDNIVVVLLYIMYMNVCTVHICPDLFSELSGELQLMEV